MKTLSKFILAGVLALVSGSMASAQTATNEVFLTGSSAYRSFVDNAILNILNNDSNLKYGYQGSSFGGENAAIFTGDTKAAAGTTLFSGLNVPSGTVIIIATSWSGSASGVANAADPSGNSNSNFYAIPGSVAGQSAAGTGPTWTSGGSTITDDPTASPQAGVAADYANNIQAHIAMSDCIQTYTKFTGTVKWANKTTHTYTALNDLPIGIVPFFFIASPGTPATFNNITTQQAQALFTGTGSQPLSLFTGNAADASTTVYAMGRNFDSGTRINMVSETGIGVSNTVYQYEPLDINGAQVTAHGTAINSITPWPVETLYNLSTLNAGNSGYQSGGKLGKAISNAPLANEIYVTYIGTADSTTPLSDGAAIINYNGQALNGSGASNLNTASPTYDFTPVLNGKYTYWGYEHLLYPPSGLGSYQEAVIDLLNTDLTVGTSGGQPSAQIVLGAMKVNRGAGNDPGALVVP